MSAVIETFCVFRYSVMLRRKTCDLVKSFLAQKASTVASIVFGSRKPVLGLATPFNVSSLLLTVDSIILVRPRRMYLFFNVFVMPSCVLFIVRRCSTDPIAAY